MAAVRGRMTEIAMGYQVSAVIRLSVKDLDYASFGDYFNSFSMFSEQQLVILEGKPDAKLMPWEMITQPKSSADLLILLEQQLRSNDSLIQKVKANQGVVELFEEAPDKDIFKFLDAVVARNRKVALEEYRALLAQDKEPIYIHTMLVWQFRHVLVPELAQGFVMQKAQSASQNFTEEELFKIYQRLYELEVQLKSGAEMPEVLIEQLVVKITK